MKSICILLLIVCVLSCKKQAIPAFDDDLSFVPEKTMKINNLTLEKNNSICNGSYTLKNEYVVSQFEIQSKYSLIVTKLQNCSSNFTFNAYESPNYPTSGYFSIVNEGLYEVKMSPKIFDAKEKINTIDFFSDKKITYQVNTDSIKSFNLNFNKFVIKVNNDNNKVLYGDIEYYGLQDLDAEVLLYKHQNEVYLFIMTPRKKDIVLEKGLLYNYLFK